MIPSFCCQQCAAPIGWLGRLFGRLLHKCPPKRDLFAEISEGFDALAAMRRHSAAPVGWKLVPIEPTEDMVIHGFESVPDPVFCPEHWEEYRFASGCQQAAMRARLCYAAMLAHAPTPNPTENP